MQCTNIPAHWNQNGIDNVYYHEGCTRLVLRSLCFLHLFVYLFFLHVRTYHVHSNYVTYTYTVAMRFYFQLDGCALSTGYCD